MTRRTEQDLARIEKLSFVSVTGIVREHGITRSTAKLISGQPGYYAGQEMAISKAKTGGYRLYSRIGAEWMDASLVDII